MQDDALDKILKDAAGQYHPAYNDKAWEGMHAKLDKHLPQKEDDRKWPWLLLPLLVTFIAAGIVWLSPGTKDEPVAVNSNTAATLPGKNVPVQATAAAQADNTATPTLQQAILTTAGMPALANPNVITSGVDIPTVNGLLTAPATQNNIARKGNASRSRTRAIVRPGEVVDDLNDLDRAAPPPKVSLSTAAEDKTATDTEPVTAAPPVMLPVKADTENKNEQAAKEKIVIAAEKKLPETEKNTSTTKAEKSKKQRSRLVDNFAFTLSAGPDYSFVKTNYPGEVQLAYGAGIAYTFAKRLTIRAGAYAAKKVYTTDSASYKSGIPLSTYYSNIEKIKGDCLVYEVPVSLSYDFAGKNKHSWFGGAGISSFFMKRETYTYYYKRNGTMVSREYTINNQNNHLLSVLTLSAGYRYRLNKRISFAAEPYFKLPLGGVGFGNLKLKSGGVLFSAAVKPFSKRK
jgi:hypothetical protein